MSDKDLFLLDTSALLTLIEDEPGAGRVEEILRENEIILPWLVLMELYYVTLQKVGEPEADRRYAMVKQAAGVIFWEADEAFLMASAQLKATYRVSLADAIIAGYAIQHEAVLLHKNPEFLALENEMRQETLPLKSFNE